jgi:hypothetical protein
LINGADHNEDERVEAGSLAPAFTKLARRGLSADEITRRIKKSLAFWGTHSWEDFREELRDGRAQLFLSDHGVWVAQVVNFPRKRLLNVWLLAGELPEVMDLQKDVEAYARDMGCSDIVAPHVRFGLKDILKKTGWQVKGYNMSLPLGE